MKHSLDREYELYLNEYLRLDTQKKMLEKYKKEKKHSNLLKFISDHRNNVLYKNRKENIHRLFKKQFEIIE